MYLSPKSPVQQAKISIGLQRGILPFGVAMKNEGSSEYTYYCSDKLVWEATGYFNDKAALNE